MNENSEKEIGGEIVPIADDNLLVIAEKAEKRIEAINKIKKLALRVTNYHDWMDQSGRPYLNVSGAEKVGRLFGISWRISDPELQWEENGHFTYTYKGYFSLGSIEIEVIGTRSSKDPFFSQKYGSSVPSSEIDKGDVKKAAFTNAIGNGITRILGIRNLTWEDLTESGIDITKISKIEYRKKSADPNASLILPNYGDHAGKAINDPSVTIGALKYYAQGLDKAIADPVKEKFKARNEALRKAIDEEIARRSAIPEKKESILSSSNESRVITGKQLKRLFAIADKSGKTKEEIVQHLKSFGYSSSKEIREDKYEEIIRWIKGEENEGQIELSEMLHAIIEANTLHELQSIENFINELAGEDKARARMAFDKKYQELSEKEKVQEWEEVEK